MLAVSLNGYSQSANPEDYLKDNNKLKQIFNGRDLKGWYSYLRTKGKNKDPEKVFNVEYGMLHISGKEFGYICTKKDYDNFHLGIEFRWGDKRWPPRDTAKRDNGILYFVQIVNDKDTVWPKSIECQVQEGDVGDFWCVDSTTIVVDGVRSVPKDYSRVVKKADNENPRGEWNRVDIISDHGTITYFVNGKMVNQGTSPSLSSGKIIVQSEGAEIFYRKIEIAEIK
ncbi:MAG: DUF1080 domain-containing protein [Bacteroidetes bacterium]|nr:MAG: DUF1080 domain-containing protein [Bacteroidota bacterium]